MQPEEIDQKTRTNMNVATIAGTSNHVEANSINTAGVIEKTRFGLM